MGLITSFVVYGSARPQGSTKTFNQRIQLPTGQIVYRPRITHSNRESLMQWRTDIRAAIQIHAPQFKDDLIRGPVGVRVVFYVTKPTTVAKKRVFPIVAPDLDKTCRALGDALEKVLIRNDSQIVHWDAWKVYTAGQSKATIEIWEPEALQLRAENPFAQPGLF